MVNKHYNNNTLEAVTQGSEVGGHPSKILSLLKTTLFLLLTNSSFAQDFVSEFKAGIDQFNQNGIIHIDYNDSKPETAEEAEARCEREKDEIRDVQINKAEIRDGRYWVDGRWICPSKTYESAKTKNELKDSDNDGYDDYTEFKNGTSPNDARIFPAIRDGNNKVVFK
jgi:hypothetical protein